MGLFERSVHFGLIFSNMRRVESKCVRFLIRKSANASVLNRELLFIKKDIAESILLSRNLHEQLCIFEFDHSIFDTTHLLQR